MTKWRRQEQETSEYSVNKKYFYCRHRYYIGLKFQKCGFFFFCLFRATPAACGGSQARGPLRATAASLRHSHSNSRSKRRLQPTPQLTETPDPQPTEQGQGLNLQPPGSWSDLFPLCHDRNSCVCLFNYNCTQPIGQKFLCKSQHTCILTLIVI